MSSNAEARRIAEQFCIEGPIHLELFGGRGNINLETLYLVAGADRTPFLLQRINTDVFAMPDRVMQGMIASLKAQRHALETRPIGHRWEVPELIPTVTGSSQLEGEGVWRLMRFIEGTISYKSLNELSPERRLPTAREVGKGLAVYADLTATIDPQDIATALPGYRDTQIYFDQLDAALDGCMSLAETVHRLPSDPEVRQATARHFVSVLDKDLRTARRNDRDLAPYIDLALAHRDLGLSLQKALNDGTIRRTAIHGDTKIENFLFDAETGHVVALVDLDTVMPLTWLADWGDMVRSLCNVAGEKERNLDNVEVDAAVYEAVMDGFLSTAGTVTPAEIAYMPRAVQVIALELGIRFLADYLRGDTYFQLAEGDPPDLNKIRALVQLKLFERLLEHESQAQRLVDRCLSLRV